MKKNNIAGINTIDNPFRVTLEINNILTQLRKDFAHIEEQFKHHFDIQLKGKIRLVTESEIIGLNSKKQINSLRATFRKLILEKIAIILRYENICINKITEFHGCARKLAAIETYKNTNILLLKKTIIGTFVGDGNRHNFENMLHHTRINHIENCQRCSNKLSQLNRTYKINVTPDEIIDLFPTIDNKILKNVNDIVTGKLDIINVGNISPETISVLRQYLLQYKITKDLQLRLEILYNKFYQNINILFDEIEANIILVYKLDLTSDQGYIEINVSGTTTRLSIKGLLEKYNH